MPRMQFRLTILLIGTLLSVCLFFSIEKIGALFPKVASAYQEDAATQRAAKDQGVIDEAPLPADPVELSRREAKNRRYNIGGRDLLSLDPNISVSSIGCGPLMPLLPTGSTPVIVLGTVISAQPYLSEDHSSVYTEYRLHLKEMLKTDDGVLPMAGDHLVVDREGGVLRLQSGRVIRYDVSGSNMAGPLHGGERYVLFLNRIHENADLHVGTGFLLRDGKAYLLGEREGRETLVGTLHGLPSELSDQGEFIKAVRQAIANPPAPRFYSEIDMNPQGSEK